MEALLKQQQLLEEKDTGDTIRVLVRVRPPNERELSQARAFRSFCKELGALKEGLPAVMTEA